MQTHGSASDHRAVRTRLPTALLVLYAAVLV
ncbi:MAG: hypothetical protein JWO31_835, partial [Phycisphaerales bacterium]|nr:hypothetical protein [Phycisphaerales bacterium]